MSVDGACNQEPDGDTRRRDSDLDRFGPSDRRNTLRPVSLVNCIEMCPLRGTPASPYIVWRRRVTSKVSYLVLYNVLRCMPSNAMHALILWAGPPLMVRPMSWGPYPHTRYSPEPSDRLRNPVGLSLADIPLLGPFKSCLGRQRADYAWLCLVSHA